MRELLSRLSKVMREVRLDHALAKTRNEREGRERPRKHGHSRAPLDVFGDRGYDVLAFDRCEEPAEVPACAVEKR